MIKHRRDSNRLFKMMGEESSGMLAAEEEAWPASPVFTTLQMQLQHEARDIGF